MSRIEEIKKEIETLNEELELLKEKESSYYVGCLYSGNYDYWDEYYHPLGYITTLAAEEWAGINADDEYSDCQPPKILKVDKDTYVAFCEWNKVHKAISALNAIEHISNVSGIIQDLREKEVEIFNKTGLAWFSFQHPGDPIYVKED